MIKTVQEYFVFKPKPLPEEYAYNFETEYEELFFETEDHGYINALRFKLPNPKGIILYYHGNSGNLEKWGKIVQFFLPYNYEVLVMDYRGFGKSKGYKNEEVIFKDAQYCYDYLLQFFPPEKIIIYGRSLGGAIATKIAAGNAHKHLIIECSFYNLQDMANRLLPGFATNFLSSYMSYWFNTYQNIQPVQSYVTFFHGTKDIIVPIKSGRKLYDAFLSNKKKFIPIEGGTHSNLSEFNEYLEEIKRILD